MHGFRKQKKSVVIYDIKTSIKNKTKGYIDKKKQQKKDSVDVRFRT